MTSFRLSYLAIAMDNLYIYELLGYMTCLIFKAFKANLFSSVFFRLVFTLWQQQFQ